MRAIIEKLLLEQPHVILDMEDETDDKIWDFCAEDKPKTWIIQLVNLYALKKLITLNKRKNQSLVMYLTQDEVDEFTKSMANDPFFIIQAKKCIEGLESDGKERTLQILRKFLPEELKSKLEL